MGVLTGWDGRSIADGVSRLQQRRAAERLLQRWSIAQLRLDDQDRQTLWAWYQGLSRQALNAHLEQGGSLCGVSEPAEVARERTCSPEEAIGLLLLAVMAEHLRYRGTLGETWSTVGLLKLPPRVSELLFSANGQPTPALRAALQAAARFFQLRHAFDDDEPRHAWATTLSLQFVFPLRNTLGHMAEWLAGHPHPIALEKILAEPEPTLESAWKSLRKYKARGDRHAARIALASCPWFDGHDHAALVEDTFRPVAQPRHAAVSGGGSDGEADEGEHEDLLLEDPRLDWDQDTAAPPRLVARVLGYHPTEEQLKKAQLLVDGEPRCKLVRQGDELRPLSTTDVPLPWRSEAEAVLVDVKAPEPPLATQTVRLQRSGVEAFERASGRRLDAIPTREMHLALWLAEGARVSPELPLRSVEEGQLLELNPPWPLQLEITFDSGERWSWRRAQPSVPPSRPRSRRPEGLYVRDAVGERRVQPFEQVEARSVQLQPARIVLPEEWEEASLMAGSRGAGRVRRLASPLRGLLGLGEPLVALESRSANGARPVPGTEHELPLASSVVDHGCLQSLVPHGSCSRLRLTMPLDLSPEHTLLVWPTSGQPYVLPYQAGNLDDNHAYLDCELPPRIRALGLGYRGAWLGSWWFEGWQNDLGACGLAPEQVLLLLRWLRLPLLQGSELPDDQGSPRAQVARFAHQHLVETLLVWGCVPGYSAPALTRNEGPIELTLPWDERWIAARKELALDRLAPLDGTMAKKLKNEVYFERLHKAQPQALAPFFEALLRVGATMPSRLLQALGKDWVQAFSMLALKVPPNRNFKPRDRQTFRKQLVGELCLQPQIDQKHLEDDLQQALCAPSRRQRALLHSDTFARLVAYESLGFAHG